MIVVDASVLIGHLSAVDAYHERATRLLAESAGEQMLVHRLTMAEVLVGAARVGRATQLLSDLRAMGLDLAAADDDQPLRLALLRVSTGLKLPDCCVLDTAIVHHAALATFDDALAREAGRRQVEVIG